MLKREKVDLTRAAPFHILGPSRLGRGDNGTGALASWKADVDGFRSGGGIPGRAANDFIGPSRYTT